MFAAGTRVTLTTAIGGHPSGAEGLVVYDLGDDTCEIILDDGTHLTVDCRDLAAVDEA